MNINKNIIRLVTLIFGLIVMPFASSVWAANADMQVSSYTWTPDPVVHGGTATFTLTVQNNGPAASTSSTLTINLPANVTYAGNASGCTPSVGNTVLTCPVGALAMAQSGTVVYTATGGTPDVQSTNVSLADNTPGNTDPNGANNTLTKLVTGIAGADLAFASHIGPASANAGDTINFVLTVKNNGPDAATLFRVTDNLPAAIDFSSVTASGGSDWSCTVNSGVPNVICDYSGAGVASGANALPVTVTGRIITTAGTITNGASVVTTDGNTGDPNQGNNTASNVTVTVNPATDLRANKSMTSSTTGSTSVYLVNEIVNMSLSATNLGPRNATGVTITDTVPADFAIGSLPSGCTAVGQIITCVVTGTLNSGATSAAFAIPLTAPAVPGSTSNTAGVARSSPSAGLNNSATVNYTVTPPYAHLTLSKTKSPTPVLANTNITNTIAVANAASSTSSATGTVTVVDTLTDYPNEIYVSVAAPWSCVDTTAIDKKLTCTYTIPTTVAPGASLPNLVITTKADAAFVSGTLSNSACTGAGYSSHTPADNAASCQVASVIGTNKTADLAITKAVDKSSLLATDTTLQYTLVVTNNGPDTVTTVSVTDPIPMYYSGVGATTGTVTVSSGLGVGESCSGIGANVTCTLKSLANGASRTITIDLNRPFTSGTNFTNIASVTSPDTVETNNTNNSASVTVTPIAAVTDVAVTTIAASLDPVKAGVQEQFTVNIKNLGPNPAAGVEVEIPIDTTLVSVVAGSISLTGSGGTCTAGQALAKTSWTVGGTLTTGIKCTGFTLSGNESRQIIYKVIPVYPYPFANYTAEANITTSSFETDSINNYGSKQVTVTNAQLDLSVTKQEAMGYDPTGTGQNLLHDPVAFGDNIIYRVTLRNNGPSQSTQVKLVDTATPPGGYTATYLSAALDAANSSYTPLTPISCSFGGGDVTCYLGTTPADSILPPNTHVAINLTFQTNGGSTPSGSLTYSNSATISSPETTAGLDSSMLNNSVTENTTVLPKTDLYVNKSVSKGVVDINEPFNYTITIGNKGSSDAAGVTVTDALPSGFVTTGAATVAAGSGVTLTTNTCSTPTLGTNGTVSCNIGPLPIDATGADVTKQVTITVPVRAVYQTSGTYAFSFNTNIANTASITPMSNTSLDPVASNNANTVNVQVRKNSITGTVYADNNLNDAITAGEGVNSVTLTLTGVDSYGNTIPALTKTTPASGNTGVYLFDKLPPGVFTIVETQPANYWDRFETVGTAGGTAPANTCDGTINCASSAAANTVSGITLPADTATTATGYDFQEYQRAQISGNVYHDANNNGLKDGGEAAINGVTVTLTGTAYNGVNVCTLVTCGKTTASGAWSYTNLPPADAAGYTVTETQPGTHLNGKTTAGTVTGTSSVAGTATGANSDVIQAIKVYSNGNSINNNFGELLSATLSGFVFIDSNSDAVKQVGETAGVTGVTVTLTGTDDLGNAVSQTTTTAASGAYSFTNLRPGSYTVTETPPTGLTHTGSQAGSKGGTGSGLGSVAISAISIVSGDNATGYNFGESGQGLAGFVYADINNNGIKDTGEPGIAGVSITLSGITSDGVTSVCSAISPNPCTLVTDASGAYSYTGLPASNGAGYVLTEQSQATAPLTNYADGTDAAGSLGGTAGNDVISSIVLGTAQFGANYNFGERSSSLSGAVYHDANNNGVRDSETGVAGVTITLSGLTGNGVNVCTLIPSCTTTTASDGSFSFSGLPASNGAGYTLTETQPVDYAERTNTPGTVGGTAGLSGINSTFTNIVLGAGGDGSGYLFGEKTGSITGFAYIDTNNDGVKDVGESGISGVVFTLSGTTASGANICTTIPSCTATTAPDGSYIFSGLRNANGSGYLIVETQPTAYLDGKNAKGLTNGVACAACSNATANQIASIPLDASKSFTAFDFGELSSSSIGGRVYHDDNNNGVYDAGEELAGVAVALTGTDDKGALVNLSVTTAVDGTYSFGGLRPSNGTGYTITETQPNGMGDYSGVTGTQVGTISAATTGTAALNVISGIVLPQGSSGVNYNFRESASSLAGLVYLDANDDGIFGGGEQPIPGVTLTLTGTDANGAAVNQTTVSAGDGSYRFTGLTSGAYTLTETQPLIFQDGRETSGVPAGAVDNANFTNNPAQNRISLITLPVATAGSNYLFGEKTGLNAAVAGKVWFNSLIKDQIQQSGEPGLQGWVVEAVQGGIVRGSTTTAANGTYSITGLPAGTGYELRFRHPVNNALYGDPISQDTSYLDSTLDYSNHTIANLTLRSGANIVEQNLPLDPSGVVYDSVTRNPVSGALVTLNGPPGFNPAVHLLGAVGNQTQITDATGFYQYILLPGAPAGTYTIAVTPPAGYVPGVSGLIPPCTNTPVVGAVPNPALIQTSAGAPSLGTASHNPAACPGIVAGGSATTQYFLSFGLSAASANVLNNHIPVDPILGGAIFMQKTSPLINVTRGGLVPYTLSATNTLVATLPNIDVTDQMPPGFKYRTGSATLNGIPAEPVVAGRVLTWRNLTFTPAERKTIKLALVVGAGVGEAEYVNSTWAMNNIASAQVSNLATATVRVVPDPTFDCSDIIGKVFDDKNANGYQDEGEPGIPNVRVVTARGLLVTTDADGRFHVACAAIPQTDHGSNFVMKLDERTLPSGYRVTTENPRDVRLTRGKMVKLNFGATIHRVVRVDITAAAFASDSVELLPQWLSSLALLPAKLKAQPSVLRIAYGRGGESVELAKQRLATVEKRIRELWQKKENRSGEKETSVPLIIETELGGAK